MKRDDQILTMRLQAEVNREKMIRNAKDRDRALARTGDTDVPMVDDEDEDNAESDESDASKIIVIHMGSQNLRIGLASDALPKTIPMCYAGRASRNESEKWEPRPKRQKLNGPADQQFGEEFGKKYNRMCSDLKIDMRANKRKVLPNSKELVVNYNRRAPPEIIPEHNDAVRVEFTDPKSDVLFEGEAAQRVPDDSEPKFQLFWPIQHGWLNENAFGDREALMNGIDHILFSAMKKELGISKFGDLKQYSCVLVIPDLYDKKVVADMVHLCLREYEFTKIALIQESLAASFGAGYTSGCIVDVGAQKTSIACVEDGMIFEDSRINLKYGGHDVTETFMKMMLFDSFPYADMNLMRRYDFLLAEELKQNFCTMNQADISVQLYNFHLRAPNEPTRKYQFKTYDEVILAPMGFYDPSIFDNENKLDGRRKLIQRSYDAYDVDIPNDPLSQAQVSILTTIKPSLAQNDGPGPTSNGDISTPMKEKPQFNFLNRLDSDHQNGSATPGTSNPGSPAPEGTNTPAAVQFGANGNGHAGSPAPFQFNLNGTSGHSGETPLPQNPFVKTPHELAEERDSVLPIVPLDTAVITSIQHAAKGDDKKLRDLFGSIMVIGGGAKTPGFGPFLEGRLKAKMPYLAEKNILVGTSPREMDGQVVVWKGASVFAKLSATNDTWVGPLEWERLGARALHHKVAWNW